MSLTHSIDYKAVTCEAKLVVHFCAWLTSIKTGLSIGSTKSGVEWPLMASE
jgi:hypothetical protein